MSWRAQNRSKDAKTPSVTGVRSQNPELDCCPVQPYDIIPANITQDPLTQHQGESFGPNRMAWRISLGYSDSISSPRTNRNEVLTELGPENQNRRYEVSSHSWK